MEEQRIVIVEFDSVSSTMDVARELVARGELAPGGAGAVCGCVLAREQTAGRGQRGREWYTAAGECLCATFVLHCPAVTAPATSGLLGLIAGVAVACTLESYDLGPVIGLKWPNDVLLNGKKACGVLVEMTRSPQGVWSALVGIGVNVSVAEFPPGLRDTATSLLLEGAEATALPDLRRLAGDIGESLRLWALRSIDESGAVITKWREFDATAGRRFKIDVNGSGVTGVAEGIDDQGALLIRLPGGGTAAVTSASSLREVGNR